jgi:hypothetical protein
VIGLIDPPGRIAGGEIYLSGMRIDICRRKKSAASAASGSA